MLPQEAASVLTVGLEDQLRGGLFNGDLKGLCSTDAFSREFKLYLFCFIKEQKQVFMVMERMRFILKALMCNFCFIVFKKSISLVLRKAQQVFDFSDT